MLFAILKTKKLQANYNLRKIHNQFGQRNSGEQHKGRQRSDSAEPYADGFPKSIDQQSNIPTKKSFANVSELWYNNSVIRITV